jgi:OmcA/MtrC family decaheme c-type cytochrome
MTVDLGPAARQMAELVRSTPDDLLAAPTPCTTYSVGDLLDHIGGLAKAFTFAATNKAGASITPQIDLRTQGTGTSVGTLAYLRFTLAKMVPGLNGDANEWNVFIHKPGTTGSGPFTENRLTSGGAIVGNPATGVYTYTFPDNSVRVSDGYVDNVVVRTIVEARSLPLNLFSSDPSDLVYYNPTSRRPVDADDLDTFIPVGGGDGIPLVLGDGNPRKNDVSSAACNACHDPLAIHGGSRRDYKYCATCHNAKLETLSTLESNGTLVPNDNLNLVNLIHKIHNHQTPGAQNIGFNDFSEVTYPQDIRNCTRCHQGPDADNTYANWMTKPTITACSSCHFTISFVSPPPAGKTLHSGGAYANNAQCAFCHPATGGFAGITDKHATENVTPNNPTVPGTLSSFEYGINSVTVAADNTTATINFFIRQDNVYLNLGDNGAVIAAPAGFSGGPSFLFAYAMPQDGVAAPVDYNNLGRTAGQPASLAVVGRTIVAKAADNSQFTIVAPNAFPNINPKSGAVGAATMRAVALQGYFVQTSGGVGLDNVGRHTFAVVKGVTGDAVRRVAVESGYTDNNNPLTGVPVGCLECHEIFEGHGGNRVSNAQVCVMCHNPNLSTSGRTITASPINPDIVALYGSNPLLYPEVSQNFKELIHGLHGAAKRTTNFVVIRNRQSGILLQGDEITYPGDLSHCGKCHLNNLYQNVQTTGRLNSTVVTTTGVAGETIAQIVAARASVPNATDLVNTPATSACGHCHDSDVARSHFVAMGGEIRALRGSAILVPPPLYPDVLATP